MRSILDDWEVTQDQIVPGSVVKFEQKDIRPYTTKKSYVNHVNKYHPDDVYEYNEDHCCHGKLTEAEIVDGKVIVTFTPSLLGGLYSHSFKKQPKNVRR